MNTPVNKFHELYYYSYVWDRNTRWMGIRTEKCPLDLWIYQEIIFETRPDFIIETGTLEGGTTLFLAHLCDLIGQGLVLSVDIDNNFKLPYDNRITYFKGDSTSNEVFKRIYDCIPSDDTVMVILDSDHSYPHVLKELKMYSPLVAVGCYLIVEDTNLGGNPVALEQVAGPKEAVADFLYRHKEFEVDYSREKFLMTFNPGGYLRRIK